MVKVLSSEKIPMLGNRFRLSVNVEILFFNDREKSDLFEFDSIVGSGISEISVLHRKVLADKIAMDILDNKRRYTVSYTLCCQETEDFPLMETVSSKEVIKIEL